MAALEFLNEAFQLFSNTTIQAVFFGINVSLYSLCAQQFYLQYRKAPVDGGRKIVFSFLYNSVLVLMAALELGASTRMMQLAYIQHGGVNGEPEEFVDGVDTKTVSALFLLVIIPPVVIGTLSPLWQLWRTWVIWAASPYRLVVTICPFLLVVAGLALDIYDQALAESPTNTTPVQVQFMLDTIVVALSVAFTIVVTLLLVGRIIVVSRRHARLMDGTSSERAKQYTSIVAMLIESYALDAVWSTATVIAFALIATGNPVIVYQIFNNTSDQVTVFAFLLVTYRVLLGRAWTPGTGRQLSTMRWNHNSSGDTTSETLSRSHTQTVPPGPHRATEDNGSLI